MSKTSLYRSGYTMPQEIHTQMIKAMKSCGETNVSKYMTRAVRAENKIHLKKDVGEFLSECSDAEIAFIKKTLKKGNY